MPVRDDGPDVRSLSDVALESSHGEVGDRRTQRLVVGGGHVDQADSLATGATGEPCAADDRYGLRLGEACALQADATGKEQQQVGRAKELLGAEVEDAGVFQEEVALLGEEEGEARQVDLFVVGLHLGEVRVERQVEREPGGQAELRIGAEVTVELEVAIAWTHIVLTGLAQDVRLHVQVELPR